MKRTKEKLESAIHNAQNFVYNNQQADGRWEGVIYYNAYPTAVMLIMYKMLGVSDKEWEHKAIEWIESNQLEDGSWYIIDKPQKDHPSLSNSELSEFLEIKASNARNTIACHLALELFNGNPDVIRKAEVYLSKIDMDLIDPFTLIFLAYFKKVSWSSIKVPPIELLLLPNNSKFGIHRVIPAWIRDAAIGALLFRTLVEKKYMFSPLRKIAIKKAIRMLKKNQLPNGSWFGTFQPTVYPLLALKEMGEENSFAFSKALEFMKSRCDPNSGYVHRFYLSHWDTGLTLVALLNSTNNKLNEKIKKGIVFLENGMLPSFSWGFAPEIILYSDCDDTAVIVRALIQSGMKPDDLKDTAKWLTGMQNKDGGWPAFIKNQASKKKGTLPTTVEDSLVILQDPSVADITSHVLYALAKLGLTRDNPAIKNAVKFLIEDQLENGSWYGRWGLCYLYGTTRVLNALHVLGYDLTESFITKAVSWLLSKQNKDGGWGEHYIAYFKEYLGGVGVSTPCQTGWVVESLTLLLGPNHKSVMKGVQYLLDNQKENGDWDSPMTVGALEIYENTNYSSIFPLQALSTYNNIKQ